MNLELLKGSRSRILAAIILVVVVIFVGRLFYLQVIQHDHYVSLAEEEQMTRQKIPANRGLIYAKNGDKPVQLVMNETVYTVFVDPAVITKPDVVGDALREIAGGNARKNLDELLRRTDTRYQVVANKLTRVQADKLKEKNFYGVGFQAMTQRVYPEGQLAAQVLGFVDTEGQGKYGVESYLQDTLKGIDGRLESVTDVRDVPLTIGNRNIDIKPEHGKNVVLSIDRNIQSKAEQALAAGLQRTGATKGSILAMDPNTGKVLAMANLPTYSPGEYFKVEDIAAFNNGTISNPYEPGSVIKPFTLAVGIDKGVVKPTDTYLNTDSIRVEDQVIGNATKGRTGNITFQTALDWSLNTGMVTVAQRLGDGKNITRSARDTMFQYFNERLRLGKVTGVELAGESKGDVISPEETEGNAVRYSNMSFGQGFTATMVQVAAGFSALVNGGNYYQPTVLDGYVDAEGEYKQGDTPKPLVTGVVSKSTSDQIADMVHKARASSFGSADKQGYVIGGKTGTSQVAVAGGYSKTDTIATYLGFGGGSTPEYVIMVSISGENKEFQGARDVLPIFTDMSNWMIDYLKIQPKG